MTVHAGAGAHKELRERRDRHHAGHDGSPALLGGAHGHAMPAIDASSVTAAGARHLAARGEERLNPCDAQHRRVADDLVELVALEKRLREGQRDSWFRGGGRRLADADDGVGFRQRLDASHVLAPAPVEHANLIALREPEDAEQVLGLFRRQRGGSPSSGRSGT
jgi:hypothetical protein